MFATEGKDADTIVAFADDLAAHGGSPDAISEVCIDMSPAFIKGIAENLPNAAITFDKFHAVKIINDAVEQVRRTEQKTQCLLRGTRYIWLRNPQTLSDRQRAMLGGLPTRHLKTARAYQIRLEPVNFSDLRRSTVGSGEYARRTVARGAVLGSGRFGWAGWTRARSINRAMRLPVFPVGAMMPRQLRLMRLSRRSDITPGCG